MFRAVLPRESQAGRRWRWSRRGRSASWSGTGSGLKDHDHVYHVSYIYMYHRSWSCKGSKMKDHDHVYGIWNMGVLRGSWIVFVTLIVSSIRCSLRCAQLDQFAKLLHPPERWRLQLPWRRVRQCWSSVKRFEDLISNEKNRSWKLLDHLLFSSPDTVWGQLNMWQCHSLRESVLILEHTERS